MHLTLFRHAKSSWSNPGLADHDRPLSKRGKRDAPMMGERLAARRARPSAILSSTAKRALTTARRVAEALDYPLEEIRSSRRLYFAGTHQILQFIMEQPAHWPEIIVVGHNPGFTDLANLLLPELRLENLVTAGCVAMDFPTDDWSEIAQAGATLLYWDYPKKV
ncbi:MAG: histidine phosphatase family protein [Proteobacteria bacterium]|nr:histidine phosphatase family protein [Pseudomonadota bacterium]